MDAVEPGDPCRDCGACCQTLRVSFYHGELDTQPNGFVPADLAVQLGPFRACMKGTQWGGGRCLALTEDKRCSIYEHRPTPCRDFPAIVDGALNPKCLELRKSCGIRQENPG